MVIIPIYKKNLTKYETISLRQCFKILSSYDIFLVAPQGLDLSEYLDIIGDIKTKYFAPKYFQNIEGYNRLMLSLDFYKEFADYDYMLVYQLDGFVFSDRLPEFMSMEYDYIGAPWLEGMPVFPYTFRGAGRLHKILPRFNVPDMLYVGNGGVSLRRISTTVHLLYKYATEVAKWVGSEDIFFSLMGKHQSDDYKIPTKEIAVQFSFETHLDICYHLTNNRLPFACHAWEKYNIGFWRPIFKQYGYEI